MKTIVIVITLFVLLAVLMIACWAIWRRHSEKDFFRSIGMKGYDGRFPKYRGKRTVNRFLKKICFKSKIPLEKWEKAKPDIEMFYSRKIYKLEQSKENMRIMGIYLIQEALPAFIPWDDSFMEAGANFAIGESYRGKEVWDTMTLPHGLCAGASSAGKTNLLRCIVRQAIYKKWNVQVLDFKGGGDYVSVEQETQKYRDLEKGYGSFITSDPEEARKLLLALTVEVRGRSKCFKEAGVSNITEYNARGQDRFVEWLIVIDEAAELMDVNPKDKAEKELYSEINHLLHTLARTSRAAGVHILMGFIRPDANVLDGQIKNNLLWRACGYFADPAASRIVLDNDQATKLPPEVKGRFIVNGEETQAYYLPIPEHMEGSDSFRDSGGDGGSGGEAERKPPEPPAAGGGGT